MDMQKLMADTTSLIRRTEDNDILNSLKATIISWGQNGITMDYDKIAHLKTIVHTFPESERDGFIRPYRNLLHEQREVIRKFRSANATARSHDLDTFIELLERCCKNFEEIIRAAGGTP